MLKITIRVFILTAQQKTLGHTVQLSYLTAH